MIPVIWMLLACTSPAQDRFFWLEEQTPLTQSEIERLAVRPLHLFGPEPFLTLELTSAFDQIVDRGFDADYQAATLDMDLGDSLRLGFDLRLRPRGNSRLKTCHFPPLLLNFPASRMRVPGLEDLDKVKLVSPCFEGEAYQRLVLREYLVYRLFNILSPNSFRVRLLRQRWRDSAGAEMLEEGYGFLIESEDWLARRLDAEEIKKDDLRFDDMDPHALLILALFEYMVGNQDWSIRSRHNVKVFAPGGAGGLIPVPYDFDFTNLVNARYPREGGAPLDLSPDPRMYKGPCPEWENLAAVLQLFREKEDDLVKEITGFALLPEEDALEMLEQIHSFMRIAGDLPRARTLFGFPCP